MKKSLSILAAVSFLTLLAGCAEQSGSPGSGVSELTNQNAQISQAQSKPVISDNSDYTEESVETGVSEPESEEISAEAVGINAEAVWGLGKSFNEITEKYGGVTASFSKTYAFENGFGKYVWNFDGGDCREIGEISAGDFISGDLSTVTLENIAEKCGFEVVPLNDTDDPNTMYEGYRMAYYTHPSYENVTFGMLYKESGFDENAVFSVRYNSET